VPATAANPQAPSTNPPGREKCRERISKAVMGEENLTSNSDTPEAVQALPRSFNIRVSPGRNPQLGSCSLASCVIKSSPPAIHARNLLSTSHRRAGHAV
jgi:hypothetical protein